MVSAQCDPGDGNNDADHAQAIDLEEAFDGVVCPDDPLDYYSFDIPTGAIASGTISLSSPQISTVLRLENGDTGERIINDWSTNDTRDSFVFEVGPGELEPGHYIVRVSFWSHAAYDHEYILITDIALEWAEECHPDGNEEPENAVEITFGSEVEDWVCPDDRLDIYHFSIDSMLERKGYIGLSASGDRLIHLYVYDSESTEICRIYLPTPETGLVDFNFTTHEGGMLPDGEYYIGVLLPSVVDDALKYNLELTEAEFPLDPDMGVEGQPVISEEWKPSAGSFQPHTTMETLRTDPDGGGFNKTVTDSVLANTPNVPWPNTHCAGNNAARSTFPGRTRDSYTLKYIDPQGASGDSFKGLLAGEDNFIYFMSSPSNTLYAYQSPDEEPAWTVQVGSDRPACLDSEGRIYYIHEDGERLVKAASKNNAQLWLKNLPQAGRRSVELVGQRVYTATVTREDHPSTYVCTYSKDGELQWNSGALDGVITGIAEDVGRHFIYIQTSQCLYQMDWDGIQNWFRRFPIFGDRTQAPGPFAPVVGSSGHIFTYCREIGDAYTYTPDGDIAGSIAFESGERPIAVCLGRDDRLYISTGKTIRCYENWNNLVWEYDAVWMMNEGSYAWFRDVAMDRDGRLYVWYYLEYQPSGELDRAGREILPQTRRHNYWQVMNTERGFDVGIGGETGIGSALMGPRDAHPPGGAGEIVIGCSGKLFLLHRGGLVLIV